MFSFQIGIPSPSDAVIERRVWTSRSWTPRRFIESYHNGSEGDGLQLCSGNNEVCSLRRGFLLILEDLFRIPWSGRGERKPKASTFRVCRSDPKAKQLTPGWSCRNALKTTAGKVWGPWGVNLHVDPQGRFQNKAGNKARFPAWRFCRDRDPRTLMQQRHHHGSTSPAG